MNVNELLNSDMTTLARQARAGFDWWVGELEAMLPARFSRTPALAAWHRFERGEVIAATSGSADTLVVPADLCLVRTLTLPKMAQGDLAALVAMDIDRIMPVSADSIVTGIAVAGPGVQPGTVIVRVGAMSRTNAAGIAAALAATEVTPTRIGPLGADGVTLAFDLAPAMRAAGLLPRLSQARRFWWAAVGVLALANLSIAVLRDRQQVDHLQSLVDAQSPALMVVRRIEDRLHGNAKLVTDLDARRRARQPLRVLGALDAALPANAWVQRLEWDGTQVRLSGYGAEGVNVVAALKQSGPFASVRANRAETAAGTQAGRPFDLTTTMRKGAVR